MESAVNLIKDLLNNYVIVVRKEYYRMCELELYLTDETHPDPFTHCSDEQMLNEKWYFHRKGRSYKEGTFKGLDMTFGIPNQRYCGILIRSIREMMVVNGKLRPGYNEVREGPCNSVEALIGVGKVADFLSDVKELPMSLINNDKMVLRKVELPIEPIYCGKRYGLSDKTEDPGNYREKPYRFLIYKDKIKKQKSDLVRC